LGTAESRLLLADERADRAVEGGGTGPDGAKCEFKPPVGKSTYIDRRKVEPLAMSTDDDTQAEGQHEEPPATEVDWLEAFGRVPYYNVESEDGPSLRVQTGWKDGDGQVNLDFDAEPDLQDVPEIGQAAENWWRRRWENILQRRQQQLGAEQQRAAESRPADAQYVEAVVACPGCGFGSNASVLAGGDCPVCGDHELVRLSDEPEPVEAQTPEELTEGL
jgi:predicted RNA-binding Zn-ribbon protein involved in translation (DUF1610 family)